MQRIALVATREETDASGRTVCGVGWRFANLETPRFASRLLPAVVVRTAPGSTAGLRHAGQACFKVRWRDPA